MTQFYKVKENPHIVRDGESKALINTDVASLMEHKKKKKLEQEVKSLNQDVQEIKQMLLHIINKINN
jgi:hypothetical protein